MAGRWLRLSIWFPRAVRRAGPVFVSVGLVAWIVWKVTPGAIAAALSTSAWPWLVLATLAQLVVLFLWDTLSLWWLFSQPHRRLPFRTFLRTRTDSVLWAAINLEVGQGAFAWELAKATNIPVSECLGRCVLLAIFDFGTLQSLALVGSFLKPDPIIAHLRWVCVVSTCGLAVLAVAIRFLPENWRRWLEAKSWGEWLAWWDWRRTLLLAGQRLVLFLLVMFYAGVCLAICKIPVDTPTVLGVIPYVLLAESLPGTGGLGEREVALVYLLRPASEEQRAMLVCFGLIWSTVVILGRVAIGLVSRWLPRPEHAAGKV
jgi:hypothetical protein